MMKKLYTLFALVLMVSMGLSMVPAVSAHGGGGHEEDHSGMPGTPMPTPPAPSPCPNCQPAVTPTPCTNCGEYEGEHHEEYHIGPMPTISPMPTSERTMERRTEQTEERYRLRSRETMSGTLQMPTRLVDAIVEVTGMTVDELAAARAEGQSWSEIIAESGANVDEVIAILIEAKAERLQYFVDEGILSEAFVQQLLDMLALRWERILNQ